MDKAVYMKHLGIPLSPLRMRYEIDRDNRRVHLVSDGFDSFLLACFAIQIEKQEGVHLIDRQSENGAAADCKIEIEMWNQRFIVDIAQTFALLGEPGTIAVALRPA